MIKNNFFYKRRILITGGTGFIGSSLITALTARQADVASIVRNSPLNLKSMPKLLLGDLNNQNSIISAVHLHQPEIVFHLAGEAIQRVGKDYKTNTEGTRNILEALKTHSPNTAFVFTSSDSVYGKGLTQAFTEDDKPIPITPYAKSKYEAEILIKHYASQHKLRTAIARMSNVYGHGDMNFSHLIPGQIKNLLSGDQPSLNSDGLSAYDFIYIDDIVQGLISIGENLLSKRYSNETFNLSTGVSTSVIDTVHRLLEITHSNDEIVVNKQSPQISDTLRQTSAKKIKNMLGWNALTDLSIGLKNTVKWYEKTLSQH